MRLRAAKPTDVPEIMALAKHSATAASWTESHYRAIFQQGSRQRVALVIEHEGEVRGFVVAQTPGAGEWEIENIVIAGEARRRGWGSHLLGALLDQVRADGAHEVYLEVRESNRAARMLYEKWAVVESGRR